MEKEIVEKLECSWKEAQELIYEAKNDLHLLDDDVINDENHDKILQRVSELWEKRKPSDEEKLEKKQMAKEKNSRAKARKEKEYEHARKNAAKEDDAAFRRNFLRCITCGLMLWCTKGTGIINKEGENVTGEERPDEN